MPRDIRAEIDAFHGPVPKEGLTCTVSSPTQARDWWKLTPSAIESESHRWYTAVGSYSEDGSPETSQVVVSEIAVPGRIKMTVEGRIGDGARYVMLVLPLDDAERIGAAIAEVVGHVRRKGDSADVD